MSTEVSPEPLAPLKHVPSQKEAFRTEDGYNMTLMQRGNTLDTLPTVASPRLPLLNAMSCGPPAFTRYHGVPRRYEETKPVMVQNFTHKKILDIGYSIHQRSQGQLEREKEQAVQEAEERLWEHAEKVKYETLDKLREKLSVEHEKAVKKLKKEHEKAIKEEALRVESIMQQLAIEQVKEERAAGEKRLTAAVKATEERCHQELLTAVAAARAEEKDMAAKEAARKAKEFKDKFDCAMANAAQEKERALVTLAEEKDWERQEAITRTRQFEQKQAAQRLAEVTASFEGRIKVIKHKLSRKQDEIYALQGELTRVTDLRMTAELELYETRAAFQKYINYVNSFIPGQADYQMPPSKVDFTTLILQLEAAATAESAARAAADELEAERTQNIAETSNAN
ncbi:uncharacterized protein C6orf163 homolog [Lineus longissimus]|uniref:uncharacterized protein C6orf163 homolog n=1 Tax=Lineus longissimus TaxID=88925 RepID=UPI002B4D9162